MKRFACYFEARRTVRWTVFIIILLAGAAPDARGEMTEITPPRPGGPQNWASAIFFDEAARGTFNTPAGPEHLNGWIGRYGLFNGGRYFSTNLFDSQPTPNAVISWDFTGSPYWLTYVTVWGRDRGGQLYERTYRVSRQDSRRGFREQVSLPDGFAIHGISFYGTNKMPVQT